MAEQWSLSCLVKFGERSDLKTELNRGVASLGSSPTRYLRPHLCLNGKEGVDVISKISIDPDGADTEFHIDLRLIHNVRNGFWLNICFIVVLGEMVSSTNNVTLTPRQTSYIVMNLTPESRAFVLERVKAWYFGVFLANVEKGIGAITKQLTEGDPLLADSYNKIFDTRRKSDSANPIYDFPYTELYIVGFKLAYHILCHLAIGYPRIDVYEEADNLFLQE